MSELTTAKISKLETAAGTAIDAARPMDSLDALTVPLPVWQPRIEPWRAELSDGLGVVVLRGLPVRQWGAELSSYAYWILGHHLGTPAAPKAPPLALTDIPRPTTKAQPTNIQPNPWHAQWCVPG